MNGNLVLSISTILIAIFFLIFSLQLPTATSSLTLGPGEWPSIILGLMIIMGSILLIKTLREKRKLRSGFVENNVQSENAEEEITEVEEDKTKYLMLIGLTFLYILAISYVGFIVTTPILLIATGLIMGLRKWSTIILMSVIGSVCLTFIFGILLNIPLPRGLGIFRTLSYLIY